MSWHINEQGPGEDGTVRRPFLPVEFRLLWTSNSVAAYLNMLQTFFELYNVSDPYPARQGLIRVYGTMHRRHPLRGGEHI